METLRQMLGANRVEVYSVDEAFVDLDGLEQQNWQQLAEDIRERIWQWTGIQVSVGIAPTKVLSKLANRLAKKDKHKTGCVYVLDKKEDLMVALQQTPVEDIWGAASIIEVFVVAREQNYELGFRHGATIRDSITLTRATSSTHELIKPAIEIADRLFKEGTWYKKAGVMLAGIVPDNSIQSDLFEENIRPENRQLMDAIDNINFSQRDDVLKFARSGTTRNWKMRQELRSPRYTTRWEELREMREIM